MVTIMVAVMVTAPEIGARKVPAVNQPASHRGKNYCSEIPNKPGRKKTIEKIGKKSLKGIFL